MEKDQFYITLPSNSSMQFFPDNRTCCYITQLPRSIELTGEWEVGLAEILYPVSFASSSPSSLPIEEITDKSDSQDHAGPSHLPGMRYDATERAVIIDRDTRMETTLPRTPSCQMFVYCDIIEPRIVGDVYTPLLRVIQACGKTNAIPGETAMKTLSPPHYIPLLLTNFRTIEINIRDHLGRPIPFESGTLTVTLHFRRVQ